MTQEIKDFISKRQKAWTKGLSFTYKFYRNRCSRECKQARRHFYEEKVNNNENINPSKWWHQVKQLAGLSKPNLLTSIFHEGEFRYGKDLAEIINVSFCKLTEEIDRRYPITTKGTNPTFSQHLIC
jgi:hypothetical protein